MVISLFQKPLHLHACMQERCREFPLIQWLHARNFMQYVLCGQQADDGGLCVLSACKCAPTTALKQSSANTEPYYC